MSVATKLARPVELPDEGLRPADVAPLRAPDAPPHLLTEHLAALAQPSPVAWGVDAAADLSIAQIRATGATFVSCYLAPGTQTWKVRNVSEVRAYLAGGLSIPFNWESDGTPGNGWGTGVDAARQSQAQLDARGHSDAPVIFTFADSGSPNLATVLAAIRGAVSVLGWDRVGAYGGINTVSYLADRSACRYFWQTAAWSGGHLDPRAQLYQRLNTDVIDYDVAYAADFGQVPRPAASGGPAPFTAAATLLLNA